MKPDIVRPYAHNPILTKADISTWWRPFITPRW